MNTIVQQKTTDAKWRDESGVEIPVNRIRKSERTRESNAFKLLGKATAINKQLQEFKELVQKATADVKKLVFEENDVEVKKEGKGNFTWYNFDHSIKIECAINERIVFDELLLEACKEKLLSFIDGNLTSSEDFVKELVNDAFQNTKGRIDTKKVMSLLKFRTRIKDTRYHDAMNLLEKAIQRPDSKTYFRVFAKDANKEYKAVELNFSSI